MTPELDYAFLADYAAVQEGKLTVVGASFTHLRINELPAQHQLYIAARVRAPADVAGVPLGIDIEAPESTYRLALETVLTRAPTSLTYDGKIGLVFAAGVQIVLIKTGLYVVNITVDGRHARRLAFSVGLLEEPPEDGR